MQTIRHSWRARRILARAALVLFLACLAGGPILAQAELNGPFRVRDMTPFDLGRLDPLPATAAPRAAGTWSFDVSLTEASVFLLSPNVGDYLNQRQPHRQPLSAGDINAVLGLGADAYYVDGEFGLLDLNAAYAISDRLSVYATLPVIFLSGGFLDSTIEGFHKTFGLGQEGRDLAARNQFQVVLALRNGHRVLAQSPVASRVGDPVFGVRRDWQLAAPQWNLTLEGMVKPGIGGTSSVASNGGTDVGAQITLRRVSETRGFYLSGSLVRSNGEFLGLRIGSQAMPTIQAAVEQRITRCWTLVLQLVVSKSSVEDTTIGQLKRNKLHATLGIRNKRGPLTWGFGISENLVAFENTPDISFALTLGWSLDRRQ